MANCAKYTRGAIGHMLKHFERGRDGKGELVKFGNRDIDAERTHLNYNLAPERNISQGEFIRQRVEQVKHTNRKNQNVACDWLITAPKDLPEDRQEEFFKDAYEWLENRYRPVNVVSAYVHMDETTPHMHFCFIPVEMTEKGEKLNAKAVIDRNELRTFHGQFQAYMEGKMGIPLKIQTGETAETGNKSIKQLKAETVMDRKKASEERYNAEYEYMEAETAIKSLQEKADGIRREIRALEAQKDNTAKEVKEMAERDRMERTRLMVEIQSLQMQKDDIRREIEKLKDEDEQIRIFAEQLERELELETDDYEFEA